MFHCLQPGESYVEGQEAASNSIEAHHMGSEPSKKHTLDSN
jgi:hypothetical protein